MLENVMSG